MRRELVNKSHPYPCAPDQFGQVQSLLHSKCLRENVSELVLYPDEFGTDASIFRCFTNIVVQYDFISFVPMKSLVVEYGVLDQYKC